MNDTPITIVGNLASDPVEKTTAGGRTVTTFRVASTPRRFDRRSNSFQDSDTLWMAVVCWQDAARNAAQSLHRGDPVVVVGRLTSHEYVQDEQRRNRQEVVADAIGHNLARGVSSFTKVRASASNSVAVGEDGTPEDYSDELIERELLEAELREVRADDDEDVLALPDSGPLVPLGR